MRSGVKKTILFHEDEAEALLVRAFKDRRSESSIVREALRRFLEIEDQGTAPASQDAPHPAVYWAPGRRLSVARA